MKWQDASEIVCGYVLKDKLNPDAVNPLNVYPTYQHIITMKREDAEMPDIVAKDFSAVDACLHAVERVNGTMKNPIDYLKILEKTAVLAKGSMDLKQIQKRMEMGEPVTAAEIMVVVEKMDTGYRRWIPMSEVLPQKAKFVKTGYVPLDKYTGGIPYACVTIIGGSPGIGKTTLGLSIVGSMLQLDANKKKKAAILSLEMTMGQIHQRYIEMSELSDDDKSRVLMNRIFNIHEMCAAVTQLASVENLCVVLIDFADLIVEGEQSEAAMGVVYRNLEILATKIEVPIILISQLNREAYGGGLPRINHLRYSGLAEATARMVLLAYNPNVIFADFGNQKVSPLPAIEGQGYIIVAKSNFGYKEGCPGGILVDWDGEAGWGKKPHNYVRLAG